MAEVTKNVVMQFLVPGTDDPDVGAATFYPVVPLLFSDNSPALGSSKIVVPFDNEGKLNGDTGVPLTCNNSPGLVKANTYWLLEVQAQLPNPSVPVQKYWFELLSTMTDPVDLAPLLRDTLVLVPQYNYATQSDLTAHVVKTIVTDHVHGGLEAPNVAGRVPTSGGTGPDDWTWAALPSGTVTAVTGTAPITSSGGTTPAIGINAATTSTPGAVTLATPSSDTTAGHVVQANDTRLSDPRAPTAHASTHISTGSDPIAAAVAGGAAGLLTGANATKLTQFVPATSKTLTVSNSLTLAGTDGNTATVPAGGGTLVITTDPRLSDPRVPTAHASTHASGGSDPLLSNATPLIESGAGAAGTAILGSKADHVHPAVAPDDPTVGGDLIGTASAATVIGLQGQGISANVPTDGQLLGFITTGPSGVWEPITLGGDLSVTTAPSALTLTVAAIQTVPFDATPPTFGMVPIATDDGRGGVFWLPSDLGNTGGDVIGPADNLRMVGIQGNPIQSLIGVPNDGAMLRYNAGTVQWEYIRAQYNEVGTVSSGHILLSQTPIVNSERIYRNSARQTPGTDYTISGNDITILWTPTGGDTILMDFEY